MAIKKYTVKASAEAKAVVASKGEYISAAQFADTLKSAKKKFNEKFKKGPYACAEYQGMGYIYYNDGSRIFVPSVCRTYDEALATVKQLNAKGSGKVAASKSFKKTVKASSSLKVKPYVINKGQSGEYYGLKNAEDNQVLHSAPNNWKSEKGAINWAKKKGYEVVDSACGKKSVKSAETYDYDDFSDIDTQKIRKNLEKAGIKDGKVVDEDRLYRSKFVKRVMKDADKVKSGCTKKSVNSSKCHTVPKSKRKTVKASSDGWKETDYSVFIDGGRQVMPKYTKEYDGYKIMILPEYNHKTDILSWVVFLFDVEEEPRRLESFETAYDAKDFADYEVYEGYVKPVNSSKSVKKFGIKAGRYSDAVPYENRKYWYFTTHGIGPGMLPKGVNVLDTQEGQNRKGTWGDYILLDAVLNTDELREYDLVELAPLDKEPTIKPYKNKNMVSVFDSCGKKSVKSSKSVKKFGIKASKATKKRKAIKASDSYYDEDIVFYFNGKKQFEGSIFDLAGNVEILCHDPKVMQVFQDYCNQFGDPFDFDGTPRDTALVFTKLVMFEAEGANEPSDFYVEYSDYRKPGSFEIYYANEGIYSAKSIKCAVASTHGYGRPLSKYTERQVLDAMRVLGYKLWGPTSSKGKVEFYNPTYAPGSVTTFLSWAEVEDYLDDIVENGISDRAYSYEEQDYMPELIEDILAGRTDSSIWNELQQWEDMQSDINTFQDGNVDSSTDIKCDWDGSSNKRFNVTALYEYNRGVSEWINTDDWSTVEEKSHTWLMQGYYVQITDSQTGESIIIDPDEYAENFDGEFAVTEEIAEFRDEVWKSMGIGASTDITASIDSERDTKVLAEIDTYIQDNYPIYVFADYAYYNDSNWYVGIYADKSMTDRDFQYFLNEQNPYLYDRLAQAGLLNDTKWGSIVSSNDFSFELSEDQSDWRTPNIMLSKPLLDKYDSDGSIMSELVDQINAYKAQYINALQELNYHMGEWLREYDAGNNIQATSDITAALDKKSEVNDEEYNQALAQEVADRLIADGYEDVTFTVAPEAISFFLNDEVMFVQPTDMITPNMADIYDDSTELTNAVKEVLSDKMWQQYDEENQAMRSAWENPDIDDPDYATQAVELSRDINCAEETVDIDDLEYITGDSDDIPDMGYGFDSNGDPVDESTVEELERIAQEILDKSEIHNIDEYADLHNFNYYASIPYIQESFNIAFTYVADIYELSKRGLVDGEGIFTTVAPYNIRFNVRCNNGEVEYAECTDVDVNDGYVKDVELKNFNLDALVQFATDLVNPVAKDIYYGTTNI